MYVFDVSCLTQHQVLVNAIIWLSAINKQAIYSISCYLLMRNRGITVYQDRGLFILRCFGSTSLVSMFSKGLGKALPFHKEYLLNQLVTVILILLKMFH